MPSSDARVREAAQQATIPTASSAWDSSALQLFLPQTTTATILARTVSAPASEPRRNSTRSSRSNRNTQPTPEAVHTYGYHQIFHSHATAQLDGPPSYDAAQRSSMRAPAAAQPGLGFEQLPSYSCTVSLQAIMALSREFSTPFTVATDIRWYEVFVVLQGTQLRFHRIKNPSLFSRRKAPEPGKLIRAYTLQHAEVGIATDFKKTELIPRHPLAHLVPPASRAKVYETDPHLFEPIREHVLRLRLETEQVLLCAESQEQLLDWVEALAAAVDIAPPLEDRTEPKYRSLPRRSRRQRQLDSRLMSELDNLDTVAEGRRLIAEQERILRELYPNLAAGNTSSSSETSQTDESMPSSAVHNDGDPEEADLDRADVTIPNHRPASGLPSAVESSSTEAADGPIPLTPTSTTSSSSPTSGDPKVSPHPSPTASQRLRYRRRCAPILLYASPRASEVVIHKGRRMRIDSCELTLKPWELLPPRYDSHGYPRPTTIRILSSVPAVPAIPQSVEAATRPIPPTRYGTEDSMAWTVRDENEITPVSTLVEEPASSAQQAFPDTADSHSMESMQEAARLMTRTKSKESSSQPNRNADADVDVDGSAELTSALAAKMRSSSLDHGVGSLNLVS